MNEHIIKVVSMRIAAVNVYEQLRGSSAGLRKSLESLYWSVDPDVRELIKQDIHRALKSTFGRTADELIASNFDDEFPLNLLHEAGHKLTDPSYIMNVNVDSQTSKPKILEDMDEFVNVSLTGDPNFENYFVDSKYDKPVRDILHDLENNVSGSTKKKQLCRQLARNFARSHPEFLDVIPREAQKSNVRKDDESHLNHWPMHVFEKYVESKADIIKSTWLEEPEVQAYISNYKNFLFALDNILKKYKHHKR